MNDVMPGSSAAEILKSLAPVDDADSTAYKLMVLEAIGIMALMLHRIRGCFEWFINSNAIQLDDAGKQNWEVVNQYLSELEIVAWEIAPARAMLLALREFRVTGKIPAEWEALLLKDYRGRIPEDRDVPINAIQVRTVIDRLKEVESFLASDMKEPMKD